jgi:hypothetical protein
MIIMIIHTGQKILWHRSGTDLAPMISGLFTTTGASHEKSNAKFSGTIEGRIFLSILLGDRRHFCFSPIV